MRYRSYPKPTGTWDNWDTPPGGAKCRMARAPLPLRFASTYLDRLRPAWARPSLTPRAPGAWHSTTVEITAWTHPRGRRYPSAVRSALQPRPSNAMGGS
jgi:hypothetical protein